MEIFCGIKYTLSEKYIFLRKINIYMRKLLSLALFVVFAAGVTVASSATPVNHGSGNDAFGPVVEADTSGVVVFKFEPKGSRFMYSANEDAIRQAREMINSHRDRIERGELLILVDGYSSAFNADDTDYLIAKVRASHVKSSFIVDMGMKEDYFLTHIYTKPYNNNQSVGVTARLILHEDSLKTEEAPAEAVVSAPAETGVQVEDAAAPVKEAEPEEHAAAAAEPSPAVEAEESADKWESARWSIKTNIPAWGFVVANAAAEYRFADHWSVDVPLYYSCWTIAPAYRFRILAAQPSLRYWFSPQWRGHFFGLHVTAGQFNIAVDKNTRYQDVNGMYGAGLDYGYAIRFSERWGLEFNIGAGYIYTKYNAYRNVDNGTCFDTATKNYWGITRCGISLTYRIK